MKLRNFYYCGLILVSYKKNVYAFQKFFIFIGGAFYDLNGTTPYPGNSRYPRVASLYETSLLVLGVEETEEEKGENPYSVSLKKSLSFSCTIALFAIWD